MEKAKAENPDKKDEECDYSVIQFNVICRSIGLTGIYNQGNDLKI